MPFKYIYSFPKVIIIVCEYSHLQNWFTLDLLDYKLLKDNDSSIFTLKLLCETKTLI